MDISNTPQPPYYAVIFTAKPKNFNTEYHSAANQLTELVKGQKGFLGYESAEQGIEITVSYWESLEAIKNWKANTTHRKAQQKGKNEWYENYSVRIAKVEKEYRL